MKKIIGTGGEADESSSFMILIVYESYLQILSSSGGGSTSVNDRMKTCDNM